MAKVVVVENHDLDDPNYHSGSATNGNLLEADANGLPSDSVLATATVTSHVADSLIHIKHTQSESAPTVDFDSTQEYNYFSTHTQTGINDDVIIWVCTDPADGAAVWSVIYGKGVDATVLTIHGKSAEAMTRGMVVYPVSPGQGDNPTFGVASNQAHHHITGITNNTVTGAGEDVEIVVFGEMDGFDTSGFSASGETMHHITNGGWQQAKPDSGYDTHVGFIVKKGGGGSGKIFVLTDKIVHDIKAALGQDLVISLGSSNEDNKVSFRDWLAVEFGKITTGGLYFDEIKEYTANAGVTVEGVLLKDNEIEADNIERMIFTGHNTWTGAGNYYDPSFPGGAFRLLRGGTGDIKSKNTPFTAPDDTGVLAANTTSWIYKDSNDDIYATTSRPDILFEDNIVLFQVLYDGTSYVVTKENHPACIPTCVSNDRHKEYRLGCVISGDGAKIDKIGTGTGGSADDRKIKIVGADELLDHGLDTTIPDSGGSAISFNLMHKNASDKWIKHSSVTEIPLYYNSSGTPTAPGSGNFIVYRIYVSKDDLNSSTPLYFLVMHSAQFNSEALANTAINNGVVGADNELKSLELAQLGYIIMKNSGGGYIIDPPRVEKTTLLGVNTGNAAATIAAAVEVNTANLDGFYNGIAPDVQAIIDHGDDNIASSGSNSDITALTNLTGNIGDGVDTVTVTKLAGGLKAVISFGIGNNVDVITTGLKDWFAIPFDCTITKWILLADASGSIVIDIWKETYANYPADVSDSITASAKPTLSSAIKNQDDTLSGWDTSVTVENILAFKVDSASTVKRVRLMILVDITGA